MKINNNTKYVPYIILFIIFILIRINFVLSSGEIENIGLKSLAISNCTWPFGVIFQCALNDTFSPFYYLLIGILKNEVLIKLFNALISFLTTFVFYLIGKKLHSEKLGIFLGLFLTINHFFLYYTNLIAPYCLLFLIHSCLVYVLLGYFKKPTKRNFLALNFLNCLLIFVDTFGFIYVACELYIINLLGKRKKIYLKQCTKLLSFSFISFLLMFPLLITQYVVNSRLIIPNTFESIGLNFSALHLMLSEYITPFLSFLAPEVQTKSTLGLLYSFFLNPDFKNINSFKIILTLFYSSILPLIIMIWLSIKVYLKNFKLKLVWVISAFSLLFIFLLMLLEKIEVNPAYTISFFTITLIILGYGIFTIKDILIKGILIACLLLIQVVNPELNAFDITINKNYSTLEPIKIFIKEFDIGKNDLIIAPHNGKLLSFYFKKHNFLDYDDKYLRVSKKKSIIRNLSSKNTKTINKRNVSYLMTDFLTENRTNGYLVNHFTNQIFNKDIQYQRCILIVDKLNSKPISQNSISKYANRKDYTWHPRKIDFRYADIGQNQSKNLYDAVKTKTLYNIIAVLNANFESSSIIEYKKIDNEYYRINSSNSVIKALNSYDSDYAFIIFE